MGQKLIGFVLAMAAALQVAKADAALAYPPPLKPAAQDAKAARLAADLLSRYHYKAIPLDDALSGQVFDQYLKSLDPEKLYFLQSDVDRMAADRTRLDDAILTEDLSAPFAIFNLYERRAAERMAFARSLLSKGLDFERDETLMIDRKDQPWPATEAESQDLWRKRVKNDWLRLRLAGQDDAAIRKVLDKRYDSNIKRLAKISSADAFQAFMNAYTTAIEPHTNYLGPRAAENFDIAMRLSLVGIGAVLMEIDGYATIRELVAGGPAMVSGQLKVGDRIVAVGQGAAGPMEDVVGWRLDDTVALIRGAVASTVRLDILPADSGPDASIKPVTLVRNAIKMQDSAAKAKVYSVTTGEGKRAVAVITLPSFYEDIAALQKGDKDYRSAARDVAQLLQELKTQKVEGVLIDLRNNGGGSLREAVALTGLFVGKVPVVQTRNAKGDISVSTNTDTGVAWNGPLGVLINKGSASASEIFAAAIQDYGRGLVIGEPSFGKGTVQTVASLDRIAKNPTPVFGDLKVTIAQFFRVNGATTQLRGVTPDIRTPATGDDTPFGESSFGNALPWTRIKAVDYAAVGDITAQLPRLLAWHESRVQRTPDYQGLLEDIAKAQDQRKNNVISLNEAVRRKERAASEKRLVALLGGVETGAAPGAESALVDDGLQFNERKLAKDLAAKKAREAVNDAILNEAVSIVSDSVALKEGKAQITASASPTRPVMVKDLSKGSSEP
ncbi:carboxyl-terminal processing protease [Roseateles asaccharophilus]|uniref:Carboxyl-terminal processing protease n=1 Tax=Roseateles asaccharophilus TaxID=582607 RepID=A0ABU2AG19_9BURK|nr:carboxy terminal-processing peptidase [Roseateles asaccharophilus]MDR7336146.1 carboxyl-terminal processing protease [Roseateles asaccharophilus]